MATTKKSAGATGANGPAPTPHKTKAGKVIAFAKGLVNGILSIFHGGNLDKKTIAAIMAKGLAIAQQLHDAKDGKLDPETLETAVTFLHGLLVNQHVLNLTDQQITDLVNKSVELAEAFEAQK